MTTNNIALAGIRVIDMSRVFAAPIAIFVFDVSASDEATRNVSAALFQRSLLILNPR